MRKTYTSVEQSPMMFTYSGNKKQLKTLIEELVEDGTTNFKNVSFVTEPVLFDYIYTVKSHNGTNEVVQDLSKVIINDDEFVLEEHISVTIGKADFELLGVSSKGVPDLQYVIIPGKGVY